jgi:DNA-binding XRE family transcriptional regulator
VCSGRRRGGRGRHDRDHRRRTAARPRRRADVVLPGWFCDAAARGDGSVLRGLRKHRGLSQVQVAESAGITQGYYSEIERGGAIPTAEVLDRISAALDLDPTWMRRLERSRVTGA